MSTPNTLQSIICDLIKEYLKKKPFFSVEAIVVFINNRVKSNPDLNKNSIEKVIKTLIKRRILIPGTKLMKNNIIEHPIRNEIYNYVKKKPANINEIMKAINIGSNQALWHLSCLEKFRFTRSKKIDNQRVIFQYESNPNYDELFYYLKQEITQEIVNYMLKKKNSLKPTELATNLKKNYNTIKKYLKILHKLNIIYIEKDNGRSLFKLNFENYEKVMKLITIE